MNSAIYVPVIKGKKNDVIALGKLPLQIRSRVKPLIEAMPVNLKKSKIDEHVFKFCDYIKKNAPIGEMFVDFYGLMPEARGCKNFCVNGQLAGNCCTPMELQLNDRHERTDRQPAG